MSFFRSIHHFIFIVKEKKGLDRSDALQNLRLILSNWPINDLKREIRTVTDLEDLNLLLGAGVRGVAWLETVKQIELTREKIRKGIT